MITSKIRRDRLAPEIIERPDEICSRCLQIQKVAAGSPKFAAIVYLDAWGNQDMMWVGYVCKLTYITPDGYGVVHIPGPDDQIDRDNNAPPEQP